MARRSSAKRRSSIVTPWLSSRRLSTCEEEFLVCPARQEGGDRRFLGDRGRKHFAQIDYGMRLDVHHVADAKQRVVVESRTGSDQLKVSGRVPPVVRRYFSRSKLRGDFRQPFEGAMRSHHQIRVVGRSGFGRELAWTGGALEVHRAGLPTPPASSSVTALSTTCSPAGGSAAGATTERSLSVWNSGDCAHLSTRC